MRTIYAVTAGEYSDYHISAIFQRREDAEAAHAAGLGDHVEDFAYYPTGAKLPTRATLWRATGWPNRTDIPVYSRVVWSCDGDFPGRPRVHVHASQFITTVTAEARTEKAAIKAVSDRLAKLKAEALEPQP